MGYSQYFLHDFIMDMGSSLGTILETTPNYKRDSYVHCEESFTRLILTKAHMGPYVDQ